MTDFELEGNPIEVVSEMKLLGLYITSDMKWRTNTTKMVSKASKKLWILRRLRKLGAKPNSLMKV